MNQISNKFIEDQLNSYIDKNQKMDFALLLSGPWGVGKTWLINNYKEKYLNEDKNNNFYYLSLNGISTTKEIDDKIFSLLYPILGSNEVRFGKELLEKTLKATLKFDINFKSLNGSEFEIAIPQIKLPESMLSKKNVVFCFDDFERCKLDITELLGYINHIVEHEKAKVIIIADEDKIENKESYIIMKEKVIGHTVRVRKDSEAIIPILINNFNENIKDIIMDNKSVIKHVIEDLDFHNYRSLKQVLLNFTFFLSKIDDEYLKDNECISQIFKYYLFLNLSIKKGVLKEIYVKYLGVYLREDDSTLNDFEKEICFYKKCYSEYFGNFQVFSWELWEEIIKNESDYSLNVNSTLAYQFQEEQVADWLKFLLFKDRTHVEVVFLANKLRQDIIHDRIKEVGEIIHIISLYMYFENEKIIDINLKTIKSCSLGLIGRIVKKEYRYHKLQEFLNILQGGMDVWGGYSFYTKGEPEFLEYYGNAQEIIRCKMKEKYLKELLNIIPTMHSDTYEFCRSFFGKTLEGVFIYIFIPVEVFFNAFIKCESKSQVGMLRHALKNSYFHNNDDVEIFIKWFKDLRGLIYNYKCEDKIFNIHRKFLIDTIDEKM